jgi:putative tricarboxylic transport membrane protein
MVLALTVMVSLSGESLVKSLLIGAFGYFISLIGIGPTSGLPRFHFGIPALYGGVDIVTIAIGVFALGEIFIGLEEARKAVSLQKIEKVFPSLLHLRQTLPAMTRGAHRFPGTPARMHPAVTAFLSYDVEKKVSHPSDSKGSLRAWLLRNRP